MPGPIGRVVKLVSGGIGLAVEAHENHKQKKAQEQARTQGHGSNAAESSSVGASREAQPFDPDEPPPEYIETTDEHAEELIAQGKAVPVDSKDVKRDLKKKEDFGSDSDSDSDINDEGEWALDDAAEAADPPSYDEVTRQMSSNSLAEEVTRLAGPVAKAHHKIPYSVILPQRRPRDKGRGFVRAYAPVLNEVGITQQTFITFQKNWLKASQADAYLNVIMLGAFAASFVPDVWAMVATTVVQVMVGTAQEMQRRHRTNTFLDQMNEQLFKPRGLYAMIMTFKPDSSRPIDGQQIGINESIAKYSSHDSGRMREAMSSMRISSGTSYGELQIPQAAPLVYPALDEALLDEQGKKQNALKGAGKFVADYMDRRAQAKFAYYNQSTPLAAEQQPQHFASRFSDPNHPVNSGHILSLVTGGMYDPRSRRQAKRDRRNERRIARGRMPRNYRLPKEQRNPKGLGRILRQDVLYLIIVNLPSDEEIVTARETLARMQKQHGYGAQAYGAQNWGSHHGFQ